ncbi:MAG: adenylate/guanylate cyclase domain-containing protein [Gammaproteobacteria bacterium]|nr:adenylate/guanylate cyclase domain-containing protein [Gammaproteobacteria bacterium]
MNKKYRIKKIWVGFLGVLVLSFTMIITDLTGLTDYRVLDNQFRLLRNITPTQANIDVVVVGIDETSLDRYKEPLTLWHPYFARFFNAMEAANARAVGVDMVLPDKSYEFLTPGYDLKLLQAIRSMRGKVSLVLAQTVDNTGSIRPLFAPIVSFAGRDSIGVPLVKPETDGLVRRMYSSVDTGKVKLPTLAGRLAEQLGMPFQHGWIDYAVGKPLDYLSLSKVLDWYEQGDTDHLNQAFSGKVVLLGAILPFDDRHRLPVSLAAWEPDNLNLPGVLIHAQSLRTLAHHGAIQQVATPLIWLLILIATLHWWVRKPLKWGGLAFITSSALLFGISTYLLMSGWYLPVTGFVFTALLAWMARLAADGVMTAIEKKRLNQSFGGYVSPNVMSEIIAGNIHPNMQGERTHVCVLFSDIRNFTSRSEHEPPENIIHLLNEYFDEMTEAIHCFGGTVDKFIGDGLMAFFGAPNSAISPAKDAFQSAELMLERLEELNTRFVEDGIEPIQIGIGLHVGEVVVGHVGSKSRHEYTIIGDTVNTTARLESLTKGLGYQILVSASVAEELGYPEGLVDLGKHGVKGRSSVPVYGSHPSISNKTE